MYSKITIFVAGVLVALFATHAYTVYQLRAQTIQNTAVLGQIVNLINSTQEKK